MNIRDKITKASALRKFEITPLINSNDIINAYDKFILEVDTLTVKSYDFDNFEASFTDYDYLVHNIEVEATVSDIFNDKTGLTSFSNDANSFANIVTNPTVGANPSSFLWTYANLNNAF